ETNRRQYEWPDVWESLVFATPDEGLYWPESGIRGRGRALFASPVRDETGDVLGNFRRDLDISGLSSTIRGWNAREQRWMGVDELERLSIGDAITFAWDEAAPVALVGPGETVQLDSAQVIELEPGWNLIGQPYPYPISWDAVVEANAELTVSRPWVIDDGLRIASIWKPWYGAWVYLDDEQAATLTIPPRDTVLVDESLDTTATRRAPIRLDRSEGWLSDESFLLSLSARSASCRINDIAIGWNTHADDAWDAIDVPIPPSPDSSLVIRIQHDDWERRSGDYAVDVRTPGTGGIWRFLVDVNDNGPVELRLSFADPLPTGIYADLIDLMVLDSVRLDQQSVTYQLRDLARFPQREIAVVVGDERFRDEVEREEMLAPSRLTLYQNYPNPFNSETTITYSIPGHEGVGMRAQLVVYNMLGQQVRLLHDGPSNPGIHTFSWDGRDNQGMSVSSGVYFCELVWGSERKLQRLIYLR
ncbi:MAG TPA: T9SS type A sorting domain-containing protein, partial [Firmicutes bacterium]|nr:T9SS type A sorting domain-containing protein [Bacillota bacterium]